MSTAEFPETEDQQTEDIRDELILLSTRGKIKYTEKFLKKAKLRLLLKIKTEYERQQTEIIDDLVTVNVIGGLATLLRDLDLIGEKDCEIMKDRLSRNELVKENLGNISSYFTRHIKYACDIQ